MTASVVISIIALTVMTATMIAVTVLVSHALANAFRALDQMHERSAQQMSGLLDRFQAIRWEDLAALRSIEEPDDGGFIPPTPRKPPAVDDDDPGQWGSLGPIPRADAEEALLISEDFPDR